jgi:alkyl hydroperoxide reductase subunit AhpF
MTPQEEKIISRWGEGIGDDILLGVVWKEDEAGRKIRAFCRALKRLVPQLRIEEEEGSAESMPEIRVRDNVRYSAVPEAKELEPFLRILNSAEPLATDLHPLLRELVQQVDVPSSIRVYISPHCPFCPHEVKEAARDAIRSISERSL